MVESVLLAVHIDVDVIGATHGVKADMVKNKPQNAPTGSSEPNSPPQRQRHQRLVVDRHYLTQESNLLDSYMSRLICSPVHYGLA